MAALQEISVSEIGPGIEMFEADGEWCVRVIENGGEQVSSFVIESFALAYAEGQRIRLGVDNVTRL
jgi:hypothetical protein